MTTEYEAARDAHLNHIYHPVTGTKETYDSLRTSQNPERWETSFSNEIGRLAQGVGDRMTSGNENIFFIPRRQVPQGRKVTHANPGYVIIVPSNPTSTASVEPLVVTDFLMLPMLARLQLLYSKPKFFLTVSFQHQVHDLMQPISKIIFSAPQWMFTNTSKYLFVGFLKKFVYNTDYML